MTDGEKLETVQVRRTFEAGPEDVFEAWIETETVERWWGCDQTTGVSSKIEPKLGGQYCHKMTMGAQGEHTIEGTFTEYDPPRRLAYRTEENQLVEVDFLPSGKGTEVVVTHSRLPKEFTQFVIPGWTAALRKLEGVLLPC